MCKANTTAKVITLPTGDILTIIPTTDGVRDYNPSYKENNTGHDWRSDFIQRDIWVYNGYSGRGNPSVAIWRHPEFQEPGINVVPVA